MPEPTSDDRRRAGEPLLEVCSLDVRFPGAAGEEVRAVAGASLAVWRGETLALVGESGSGKSTLALAIPGLISAPGRMHAGEVWFRGSDLTKLSHEELRRIRGREIAMVFQEPATAFNPVLTIGAQIAEGLVLHAELSPAEARERAVRLLARVGFSQPARWMDAWPHQLSGGMLQRAMIAMAIAPGPRLLIADEPTTAVDSTVQVQILELLEELCREQSMALLLVSHSLGLVASWADRVAVMVEGRIVERGPVSEVFRGPRHPYTRALFESEPGRTPRGQRLPTLPPRPAQGLPGEPGQPPQWGCVFRRRCAHVRDLCGAEDPQLAAAASLAVGTSRTKDRLAHLAACHFPLDGQGSPGAPDTGAAPAAGTEDSQ